MSRKRNKRALQRAVSQGNVLALAQVQAALAAQQQRLREQDSTALFSPGIPLPTQPGVNPLGNPRQWSFPIAWNASGIDRSRGNPEIPSFQQLRSLARLLSYISICERVVYDMIARLTPKIELRPELKTAGMKEEDFADEIKAYTTFFKKPDRVHDLHSWLRMAYKEQMQIDELYVFKHKTRGGKLWALEIIAGDTFKPLLDDWGRVPQPPVPFAQQFPWGYPGDWYTTDELLHYSESPSADSAFGFSRVERVITEVNQALRKKKQDLARYTDGNIPAGIMEVPPGSNWTPDQIDSYEQMWNALLSGNTEQIVKVKFTQPGMKFTAFDQAEIKTDFDLFLFNIVVACYGLSMADVAFVADIHKSADEGQQNMMYRRTLYPLTSVYATMFTDVIENDFGDDRFIFSFGGFEEVEDVQAEATAFTTLAQFGIISPKNIAAMMHLPDVPDTGPFILSKQGPVFLKDLAEGSPLRQAQMQAQLAGLQMATQNPAQQNTMTDDEEEDEEDPDDSDTTDDQDPAGQDTPDDRGTAGQASAQKKNTAQTTRNTTQKRNPKASVSSNNSTAPAQADSDDDGDAKTRAVGAEWRRWRTVALHDIKAGRRLRPFVSDLIPDRERNRLQRTLERCTTADEVKEAFKSLLEGDPNFFAQAVQRGGHPTSTSLIWRDNSRLA